MIIAVCAVLLLLGCGGKKERKATSSQLIGQVEQFSIDTIVTKPGDTLVNNTVDGVLRHYPELYRATQKAVKAYDKWVEISKVSGLKVKPETLNVNAFVKLHSRTYHSEQEGVPQSHGHIDPTT